LQRKRTTLTACAETISSLAERNPSFVSIAAIVASSMPARANSTTLASISVPRVSEASALTAMSTDKSVVSPPRQTIYW
jgi:hypothetical protein